MVSDYLNNKNRKSSNNKNSSDKYINKEDIERAAREAALQYCPVSPSYNPSQYVRKSEIPKMAKCPEQPDMKDYVLKSSIPPKTQCPSCICPKVKVTSGLCKKCHKDHEKCPPCKKCTLDQCKHVVKCPEPKACPPPAPCPEVKRCKNTCPKCKYYGVKNIYTDKTMKDIVQKLLDDKDYEKIQELKDELDKYIPPDIRIKELNDRINELEAQLRKAGSQVTQEENTVVSPVVDYNNKCVNSAALYNSTGILGSRYN